MPCRLLIPAGHTRRCNGVAPRAASGQYERGPAFQFAAYLLPFRQKPVQNSVIALAVVMLPQMSDFVQEDVIKAAGRGLDELRVLRQHAVSRTASPAAAHDPYPPDRWDREPRDGGTERVHPLRYASCDLFPIPEEKLAAHRLGIG